jgi:hypothetical protein
VMPTEMLRHPLNTRFPGTSPATNVRGPPPPINISPQRGMVPQRGPSNEQSSLYFNNSVSNNTPGEDSEQPPPPPPLFASNGPYPRTPPRKTQTLPS